MLKLRKDNQRVGRIRLAGERQPPIWLWTINIHLTGGLPMGSAQDLDTAKAEFAGAWTALKVRTSPEDLSAAYRDMNIRDDD